MSDAITPSEAPTTEAVCFLALNPQSGCEEYRSIDELKADSFEHWVAERLDANRLRPILIKAIIDFLGQKKERHKEAAYAGKVQSYHYEIPTQETLEKATVVLNFRHPVTLIPGLAVGKQAYYLSEAAMPFVPRFLAPALIEASDKEEFIQRIKEEIERRAQARETWIAELEKQKSAEQAEQQAAEAAKISAGFDDLEDL